MSGAKGMSIDFSVFLVAVGKNAGVTMQFLVREDDARIPLTFLFFPTLPQLLFPT